ncbi:MAG: dihydroneopterin aldolase [Alcanivorax sp.]
MHSAETDIVYIRDLTLDMSAGIYEHEKQARQRVIVNVEMTVTSNEGRSLESIDDVVSYENVVLGVRALAEEKHYDLLEDFAEKISVICLTDDRVLAVSVQVEKPDIFNDCAAVGVRITRA